MPHSQYISAYVYIIYQTRASYKLNIVAFFEDKTIESWS